MTSESPLPLQERKIPSPLSDFVETHVGKDDELRIDICRRIGLPEDALYEQIFSSKRRDVLKGRPFGRLHMLGLVTFILDAYKPGISPTRDEIAKYIGGGIVSYDVHLVTKFLSKIIQDKVNVDTKKQHAGRLRVKNRRSS